MKPRWSRDFEAEHHRQSNCSTAQLVVALKPLHDPANQAGGGLDHQSVSGAGKDAMDELANQTKGVFATGTPKRTNSQAIAFNVIPQIDVFMEDGSTKEEWKMTAETKKILDPDQAHRDLRARAGVRRPSEAVNIEFERPISPEEGRDILLEAPGCRLMISGAMAVTPRRSTVSSLPAQSIGVA